MLRSDLEYIMTSLPYLSFSNTEETRLEVLNLLTAYEGKDLEDITALDVLDNEAAKFLSPEDHDLFRSIDLKHIHSAQFQESKSKALSDFSDFVLTLKRELASWRDPQSEKPKVRAEILQALVHGSPLEIEERLLKLQWDELEDLSSGHFSDLDALVIYKLKLSILLRWWSFDSESGFGKFIHLTQMKDHG